MNFNPRTPHGVRPLAPDSPAVSTVFQSTHPSRGATCPSNSRIACIIISIHAPLTGCDPRRNRYPQPPTNFNPRTPHGVRLRDLTAITSSLQFQSTHPSRGATSLSTACTPTDSYFNPRTPHGVRLGKHTSLLPELVFQSTHPSRGATFRKAHLYSHIQISIHAPLTGCDWRPDTVWFVRCHFNPRTPHGVRLPSATCRQRMTSISIHAPLTGCDDQERQTSDKQETFQSTHPSRGATGLWRYGQSRRKYFNPRTPHGVRR